MQIKRRILTVGTTFFLAAATGHVMQNGNAIGTRFFGGDAAKAEAVVVASADAQSDTARIDEASVTPLSGDTTMPAADADHPPLPQLPVASAQPLTGGGQLAARMIKVEQGFVRAKSAADATYNAFGLTCGTTVLDVTTAAPALLMVDLTAPCHLNERLILQHAGIDVTLKTDAAGHVSATIPAMVRAGGVSVHFMTGEQAEAARVVPDIASVQRVAILSGGRSGFVLNVYENGASYAAAGHVRATAPRDPSTTEGGFMVTLGDASLDQPQMAQIYSAPVALQDRRIEVETQVTSDTCGKAATAEAVWMSGGEAKHDTISLTMPGCDTAGDLIVMDMTPFLAASTQRAAAD
jgi:hypothetical protein